MKRVLLALGLLTFPGMATANAGIPMLAIAWPAYWLALLPVILFEAGRAQRMAGLTWRQSLKMAAWANLVSTLAGIPMTWGFLLILQIGILAGVTFLEVDTPSVMTSVFLFPFMSAWVPPYENTWAIYAAFVILAIPFCLASIIIEAWVAKRVIPTADPSLLDQWARQSNIRSYAAIAVLFAFYPLLFAPFS